MNGIFHTKNGREFTIEMGGKISAFPNTSYGYPNAKKRYDFYPYSSIQGMKTMNNSIDITLKKILDNRHQFTPIKYFCPQLGLYLSNNNELFEIFKTDKGFSVDKLRIKYEKLDYQQIIKELDLGHIVNIYGHVIEPDKWQACRNDITILDQLDLNEELKNLYIKLLDESKKMVNDTEGGYALVKRSSQGFASQFFITAVAGFGTGIIFLLLILVIKNYL